MKTAYINKLTEKEFKTLQDQRLWGYLFATFVMAGASLVALLLFAVQSEGYMNWIGGVFLSSSLLSIVGCWRINRNILE